MQRSSTAQPLNATRLIVWAMALTVLLLLLTRPLYAANWEEFRGKAMEATTVFVDSGSAEIEHDTVVKGWVKFEYEKPKYQNGREVISRMTYRTVNCENGRYWVTEDWLTVKNSVDPILLPTNSGAQEWQKAPPSSEAEMAVDALCYETKSLFGVAWDTVKEAYHSPKARIEDISSTELASLGMAPGPDDTVFKAWVGVTSIDSWKAEQNANHVIIAKESIQFIGWDKEAERFKKDTNLPISHITSVALVRGGNYEQLKQIQLITPTGKTVISFSTGEDQLAEKVYAVFLKAGIKEFTTSKFVHGFRVTKPQ